MRALVVVACAALTALAAGCKSQPETGFELAIQVPGAPSSSQLMCPAGGTQPVSASGADNLRLTVFRENALAEGGLEFVCDRVIPVEPPGPNAKPLGIYAPIGAGERARIVAEAWQGGAPQTDAGVPADAAKSDATQTDAPPQADAAGDAPAQTDVLQSDGPKDGPKDGLQSDAPPPSDAGQSDAAPQSDGAPPADAGRPDGGTPVAAVRLIGSGQVRDVDLRAPTPRTLVIDEPRAFNCAIGLATEARAFHTATVLPDGRVALVGGLSLGTAASSLEIYPAKLYASASVDLYNPETQTFVAAVDGTPAKAIARSFHGAFLLTSEAGKARILLVGGLTSSDQSDAKPLAEIDGQNVLDIAPFSDAKAAAAQILVIDLQAGTFTREDPPTAPLPRFMQGSTEDPPAPLASDYPLVVGGATAGKGKSDLPTPQTTFEFLDAVGAKPGTPVLPDAPALAGGSRLGASVTDIGLQDSGGGPKPTWLVLGGNLWSATASLTTEMAEYVTATVTDGVPKGATSAFTAVPNLPPTAFHTATPVRDADGKLAILVAGGFLIQPSPLVPTVMAAFDPATPGSGTPILSLIEGPTQVATLSPPAGFKAVGFHDAVRLADNSVLVTGGSPYNVRSPGFPNECPWNDECRPVPDRCAGARVQQNSRQCAVCQAVRYFHAKAPGQRALTAEGNLKVARFGHRSTLLWDGRVLITGGITSRLGPQGCSGADTDALLMLTSAEIYNPQRGDEDPISKAADPTSTADPPARLSARPPGEGIADTCCTCPSTVAEAKAMAKQCANKPKQCTWSLQ